MSAPVITGLGCVSAVGEDVPSFWRALLAGDPGIKEIRDFPREGLRNTLAGVVPVSPSLRGFAEREQVTSRLHLFAFAALDEALRDAGFDPADFRRSSGGGKAALVIGTSLGMSLAAPEIVGERLLEYEGGGAETNADLGALITALEQRYGLRGEVTVISTACASATHAIALARDMIRLDGYDIVIAGGADSLDRMKYLGHTALSTLTTGVPRPFSRSRDGTLFGEGAGFLVIEAAETDGKPRGGRRCYATCAGAGYSTDVYHVTAPDPDGVGGAMAIRAALADAGIAPEEVGHVNLHGSGTALNDSSEFSALTAVFGERTTRLPSTSIKAAVGHAMGAAGAVEAVATVLAVHEQIVPPTLNVAAADVDFALDLVTGESRQLGGIAYALSNSFGFGGANGALVFGRA